MAGRGRRGVESLSRQSPDSSPSPERLPQRTQSAGKRKCYRKEGGSQQKKGRTAGGGKGKGKATGSAKGKGKPKQRTSALWNTTDPATTYPEFDHEYGPTIALSYDAAPTDFFTQVYPPQLIDLIVEQTNVYAEQRGVTGWVDTTAREIEAFLGFVMATSVHSVPRLNNIWSSDWILGVPALAAIFPRYRFWQLWANLHLADNTLAPSRTEPSFDRLYKLQPLLNILGDAFEAAHEPSQQLSVDEAMVRYKGRSSLKQYMPKKPVKRGFKIWCLCDANGGYLQKFQIYTGIKNSMVKINIHVPNSLTCLSCQHHLFCP